MPLILSYGGGDGAEKRADGLGRPAHQVVRETLDGPISPDTSTHVSLYIPRM